MRWGEHFHSWRLEGGKLGVVSPGGVSSQRTEGGDIRGGIFPFRRRGRYVFADIGVLCWSICLFSGPVGRGEKVHIPKYKVGLVQGMLIPLEPGATAIV